MTHRTNSAQNTPVISDEILRASLRRSIDLAINIKRDLTRDRLAQASGVSGDTIDQILYARVDRNPEKVRRIKLESAMSLAWVLGEYAVNGLIGVAGYGGARSLESPGAVQPVDLLSDAFASMASALAALPTGQFDHTNRGKVAQHASDAMASLAALRGACGDVR